MKKIMSSVLFLAILAGSIYVCGNILRPVNTDVCKNQIQTFHSLEEDSIDVMAYGSSRCWRGFSSVEFQNEYGVTCYNYGCNWQKINTTWLFLKDSLLTQSPKVAFVETGFLGWIKEDQEVDGEIYYTRELKWTESKKEYLEQCFGSFGEHYDRYLSYFVPFVMDHANWESIKNKNFVKNSSKTDFIKSQGSVNSNTVVPLTISYNKNQEQALPEASKEVLDDIVKICQEEQITLVFYTVPFEGEYHYADFFEQYAKDNNCYYVNLFDHMDDAGINEQTDFSDKDHLNTVGAIKATNYLGEYLEEHQLMP